MRPIPKNHIKFTIGPSSFLCLLNKKLNLANFPTEQLFQIQNSGYWIAMITKTILHKTSNRDISEV